MNFITSYYWRREGSCKNTTALLLQQVKCKKDRIGIAFACICAGKTVSEEAGILCAYITEQLQNWFYEKEIIISKGRKKTEKELNRLLEGLKALLGRLERELQYQKKIDICGFLCMNDRALLFEWGNMRLCMLNNRYGRGNIKYLLEEHDGLKMQCVTMQRDVGLLIATSDLYNILGKRNIADCLMISGIMSQKQTDNHLQELCRAAEQNQRAEIGAVLLYTCN